MLQRPRYSFEVEVEDGIEGVIGDVFAEEDWDPLTGERQNDPALGVSVFVISESHSSRSNLSVSLDAG